MSFAKTFSATTEILDARIVSVEVDTIRGLYAFTIVGLPDKAVEEARDRVSSAIKNSGFQSPKSSGTKIVVSLAPAELKKEGSSFDLPIALAYLLSSENAHFNPKGKLFLGELSLDGEIRPVRGILPLVAEAKRKGFTEVYVPKDNAPEATLVEGITIFAPSTLKEILSHLSGQKILSPALKSELKIDEIENDFDFSDIRGQESAKRGLIIAASGGHNASLSGPPGTGKTMLARAMTSILPPLSFEDILEVTGIHSIAGVPAGTIVTTPPFRSPHHTSSYVSLVGGGATPKPGEVTLAHKGVLFLDEFPEFDRRVIEALRQPLEDRFISVSRARGSARFPADIILIASMNPCPCGHRGNPQKQCICMPGAIERYKRKLSGPILDRIDIFLTVANVLPSDLSKKREGGSESKKLREIVSEARNRQKERARLFKLSAHTNANLRGKDLEKVAPLGEKAEKALADASKRLSLSARSYHRVWKLARTIADLANHDTIQENDVFEAVQYRPREM